MGAEQARELPIPGRELKGVHLAMDYLTQQNKRTAGISVTDEPITAKGKRVVIIGGGDTGSDCLGTNHRQGLWGSASVRVAPEPPPQLPTRRPAPSGRCASALHILTQRAATASERFRRPSLPSITAMDEAPGNLVKFEVAVHADPNSAFEMVRIFCSGRGIPRSGQERSARQPRVKYVNAARWRSTSTFMTSPRRRLCRADTKPGLAHCGQRGRPHRRRASISISSRTAPLRRAVKNGLQLRSHIARTLDIPHDSMLRPLARCGLVGRPF